MKKIKTVIFLITAFLSLSILGIQQSQASRLSDLEKKFVTIQGVQYHAVNWTTTNGQGKKFSIRFFDVGKLIWGADNGKIQGEATKARYLEKYGSCVNLHTKIKSRNIALMACIKNGHYQAYKLDFEGEVVTKFKNKFNPTHYLVFEPMSPEEIDNKKFSMRRYLVAKQGSPWKVIQENSNHSNDCHLKSGKFFQCTDRDKKIYHAYYDNFFNLTYYDLNHNKVSSSLPVAITNSKRKDKFLGDLWNLLILRK